MSEAFDPVDGTRISYDVTGEGPAIVWLHGSALSRVPWRGLGYLRALPGYTHVRIDARGHGRSDKPHDPDAYSADLLMEDVLAVLDAEGIEQAAVVGYSMGARTAWQLVTSHPSRFPAMVALGGTHRAQRPGDVGAIFYPGYLEPLQAGDIQGFVDGFGPGLDPNTRAAFLHNDPLALAAWFQHTETASTGLPDLAVRRVRRPVLLVAGSRDGRRYSDALDEARMLPHGRFAGLEGVDHAGTLGAVDLVLAELVPFMHEQWPAAPGTVAPGAAELSS